MARVSPGVVSAVRSVHAAPHDVQEGAAVPRDTQGAGSVLADTRTRAQIHSQGTKH